MMVFDDIFFIREACGRPITFTVPQSAGASGYGSDLEATLVTWRSLVRFPAVAKPPARQPLEAACITQDARNTSSIHPK